MLLLPVGIPCHSQPQGQMQIFTRSKMQCMAAFIGLGHGQHHLPRVTASACSTWGWSCHHRPSAQGTEKTHRPEKVLLSEEETQCFVCGWPDFLRKCVVVCKTDSDPVLLQTWV